MCIRDRPTIVADVTKVPVEMPTENLSVLVTKVSVEVHRPTAVSYTHLDVYKRQI